MKFEHYTFILKEKDFTIKTRKLQVIYLAFKKSIEKKRKSINIYIYISNKKEKSIYISNYS